MLRTIYFGLVILLWETGQGHASITEPCSGVQSTALFRRIRSLSSTESLKKEVYYVVMDAVSSVQLLINKYTDMSDPKVRIASEDAINLSPLQNYTTERKTYDSENLAEMIQDDFNNVATMMVFVNVVHDDEVANEAEMDKEMWDLVVRLNRILCRLDILADHDSLPLDKTIQPQVPLIHLNLSLHNTYIRDYAIFMIGKVYLTDMTNDY